MMQSESGKSQDRFILFEYLYTTAGKGTIVNIDLSPITAFPLPNIYTDSAKWTC